MVVAQAQTVDAVSRLSKRVEDVRRQQLVSQPSVEALHDAVLPRGARTTEFVSGGCHRCHRYRNWRNQPNSLDPSQVSTPVGTSLGLTRQLAEGSLPHGLWGLVHGALLTSVPSNMGVHEIEAGLVGAVRNKSSAKASGTHQLSEHQLATEEPTPHPVLKSRPGLLLHA